MSIKILLADDHKLMREGLRALLEKQGDIAVIGEAEDGRTTVKLARQLSPDIVIMDISMPDMNGIEATRQIVSRDSRIKIIALSVHSDKRFVVEMLNAGASAYLLKGCAFNELINAVRTVIANHTYLSPEITDVMIQDYKQVLAQKPVSAFSILTGREREVLQLLAEGHTTKHIAAKLDVSVKTVETYRHQIMDKLHIHSVADLTKYAIKEGLTSL